MLSASAALARLREGNRRFADDRPTTAPANRLHRAALVEGQRPFAIVLGCSDSRVPGELVFDAGFGELFVIRVAGNIVAPSQIASVEFAASRFATRLVVVMGHTQCGVVTATLEDMLGLATPESEHLRSIVDRVRPALEDLVSQRGEEAVAALVDEAVRANILASVDGLGRGSALLQGLMERDGLEIVGAEYALDTGLVTFL